MSIWFSFGIGCWSPRSHDLVHSVGALRVRAPGYNPSSSCVWGGSTELGTIICVSWCVQCLLIGDFLNYANFYHVPPSCPLWLHKGLFGALKSNLWLGSVKLQHLRPQPLGFRHWDTIEILFISEPQPGGSWRRRNVRLPRLRQEVLPEGPLPETHWLGSPQHQ